MSTPEITFALGLKPAAAVEWLKAKGVTAENYRNLTASEIAKVYTIARISDLEMLNDIKQSMITAADNAQSYQNWRKDILQHLQNKGWLHPNGHNGKDIIDPQTGEVFGAPRRPRLPRRPAGAATAALAAAWLACGAGLRFCQPGAACKWYL